jgi:hypothetical protein
MGRSRNETSLIFDPARDFPRGVLRFLGEALMGLASLLPGSGNGCLLIVRLESAQKQPEIPARVTARIGLAGAVFLDVAGQKMADPAISQSVCRK